MVESLDLYIRQAYYHLSLGVKGRYSIASQASVLKILEKFYDVKICRRTLNYHLSALEKNEEIRRVRRHKKLRSGGIRFRSTLVFLKKKAIDKMKKLASWFRKNKFNDWYLKGFDVDAPRNEMQAKLIATFIKTTSS